VRLLMVGALTSSCARPPTPTGGPAPSPGAAASTIAAPRARTRVGPAAPGCGGGRTLTVHFYWVDTPTSDRLWATERDGDVVLTTTGDGSFTRR
jgi:hypothetical protein